jgi:hypothetical protein
MVYLGFTLVRYPGGIVVSYCRPERMGFNHQVAVKIGLNHVCSNVVRLCAAAS